VRLFEAAAVGTPILSDRWDGLDTVLVPGREILAQVPLQLGRPVRGGVAAQDAGAGGRAEAAALGLGPARAGPARHSAPGTRPFETLNEGGPTA
jgi:hypothetical protein